MLHRRRRAPAALGWGAALLVGAGGLGAPLPPAAAAEPGDREGPPATHQVLTVSPLGRTHWLLAAPPRGNVADRSATLFAFTEKSNFHILRLRNEEAGGARLIVERYPIPSDLAVHTPPIELPGGRFAGAGRDGLLIVVNTRDREWRFVRPSVPLSVFSRPAALARDTVAAVGADGSLLLFRDRGNDWSEIQRILPGSAALPGAGALKDAVLAVADLDGDGRKILLVPAAPSGRYGHGVLGDAVEPTELRAYKLGEGGLRLSWVYPAGGDGVFEALGALAADLDGDGREEILITRSDARGGAAHLVLGLSGGRPALKARGAAVGAGNRWSHLLGTFDVDGSGLKILALETPHLAGYLLALRMHGGELRERARRAGFTTHTIGSRNLWQFALLGRGGLAEAVLQDAKRSRLAALALFGRRWVIRWTHPLPAPAHSNFLAADFNGDGRDDLALADADGTVHLFLSRGR